MKKKVGIGGAVVAIAAIVAAVVLNTPASNRILFPVIAGYECSTKAPKARIAWAHKGRVFNPEWLCLPGGKEFKYHDWDSDLRGDRKIPVVWSNDEALWLRFTQKVPPTYTGFIFFANEPDRPDQANMSVQQTAALAKRIADYAPRACLVGPMYSTADNGVKSRQVYDAYVALGGKANRLCAGSLHIYPRPGGPTANSALGRINEYYNNYMIPTGQGAKKTFVTEIGITGIVNADQLLYTWLVQLNGDSRITAYYIYTTYQRPTSPFLAMFDWTTEEPTSFGRAARAAIGGAPYPNPYPAPLVPAQGPQDLSKAYP